MSDLDAIKKRIHGLLALTDERSGASESEALFAAKKVGELLEEYNLSLDEISVRDEAVKIVKVSSGLKVKNEAIASLARAVKSFTDCSYYFSPKRGYVTAVGGKRKGKERYGIIDIEWCFVGVGPDADMAEFLMRTLINALRHDTNAHMKTLGRSYHGDNRIARSSFEDGFATRIADRLHEMKEERDADLQRRQDELAAEYKRNLERYNAGKLDVVPHNPGTGTALITLKNQMIESHIAEEVGKLRTKRTYSTRGNSFNSGSYNAGRAAGERANLSRPLGSEGRNQLRLT